MNKKNNKFQTIIFLSIGSIILGIYAVTSLDSQLSYVIIGIGIFGLISWYRLYKKQNIESIKHE